MKQVVKKIIKDFKINMDGRLADEMDNYAIILKDPYQQEPQIIVESKQSNKVYNISSATAHEIISNKYSTGVINGREYQARALDVYWFLLDNNY